MWGGGGVVDHVSPGLGVVNVGLSVCLEHVHTRFSPVFLSGWDLTSPQINSENQR